MKNRKLRNISFVLIVLVIVAALIYAVRTDLFVIDKDNGTNSNNDSSNATNNENPRLDKVYISKDLGLCSRIKYMCEPGFVSFQDGIGCGCEKSQDAFERNYCDIESRSDVCTKIYSPVCGWANENIRCIKYPCASNYGNSCEACGNENVAYWTEGVCPE